MKRAFITGITGQTGSYLAELLLGHGYEVHGLIRRSSSLNTARIDHIFDKLKIYHGDLTDSTRLGTLIAEINPHEIYHLAAQSHVKVSFDMPVHTVDVDALGTMKLLEAVRCFGSGLARIYNAGSSEMFGGVNCPAYGYDESRGFHPRSPYGCAKVFSYWATTNYRESYGLHASNGILFNHESPRRGETFVTRKITRAIGRIKAGLQDKLFLGNLAAKRDWGFAGDYAEVIWRIVQHDVPEDFVIATGETHSVQEFVERAFDYAGLNWEKHVEIDQRYFRPAEVDVLLGDARKAKQVLGWEPKTKFDDLVRMMVDADRV